MTPKRGWRRVGSRKHFRSLDARGKGITDPEKLARIEALVIPPAWRDVRISTRAGAKVQAPASMPPVVDSIFITPTFARSRRRPNSTG